MDKPTVSTLTPNISEPIWDVLQQHYHAIKSVSMNEWFANNPQRFNQLSIEACDFLLDYSKNRITAETIELLCQLAKECQLESAIKGLFAGDRINCTEDRPALHTALRDSQGQPIYVDGQNIKTEIQRVFEQMASCANAIRRRERLGFSGDPIDTIINIGIGGSDLGPMMAYTALAPYVDQGLNFHFISHQDPERIHHLLTQLNPATTLLIVASKSFTTAETIANAKIAKQWLAAAAPNFAAAQQQWIAITEDFDRALMFDMLPENIFLIWNWVGGRFSIWSAIGLVVAIAIGMDHFHDFLAGGLAMDQHFLQADFAKNMPVILALLDIWYHNCFAVNSRAIIPYGSLLRDLTSYLQQVHMESLGKRVCNDGSAAHFATGMVIWGGTGTNSQHSFHQLLMQGTQWIPVDFILPIHTNHDLIANCLAQSQALMQGYTAQEIRKDLQRGSYSATQIEKLLPHQIILGNCPSNTILIPRLTPYALGSLLALYEHKVFVQSVILAVNAFDQWGVMRGKHLAEHILLQLKSGEINKEQDASTRNMLHWILT